MIEDLHLRNDTSLIDHEVAQKLELGGGQVDRHSGASDFMCVFVDDKVGDTQLAVVAALAQRAAQDGTNTCDDFLEAEGLGDVIVAADRQSLVLVANIFSICQEKDVDGDALITQATGHCEAVHIGEHNVQNDQVGAFFLSLVVSRCPVFGRNDIKTCKAQR